MKTLLTWKMFKTLQHSPGLIVIKTDTNEEYHLNKHKRLVDKNKRYYNPKLSDMWVIKQ